MRGRPQQYRDFSGGLNTKAGPYGLGDSEASSVLNFRPTMRGSLRSRKGDEQLVPLANLGGSGQILSLSFALLGSPVALGHLLVGMSGGNLYDYVAGNTATLLGTYTANGVWSFAEAPTSGGQGPMYGVNGTDAVYVDNSAAIGNWTGSVGTFPGGVGGAKYLAYAGNRMWAAGMTTLGAMTDARSAVCFSQIGDPRDWPTENVVQFDPGDGEDITGIAKCGSGLVVFKRSKAWFVYDLDTGANRPLGVGVGCVGHRTIHETPIGTIFLGDEAVWVTDGSSVRRLSDNIEPDLLAAGAAGSLRTATATVEGQRYIVTWPTGYLYEYDWEQKSWWTHTTRGNVLTTRFNNDRDEVHVGGASGLDRMFRGSSYVTAGGANLSRIWAGPYLTLGPGKDRLRGLEVEGFGRFGVAALPDFAASPTTLTTREVRAEELLGAPSSVSAVRREGDFKTFQGVQPYLYATGANAITGAAVGGYTPTDVQIDALSLYITRRPG